MLTTVRGRPIVEAFVPHDPWSLFAAHTVTPAQLTPRGERPPSWFLWRDVLPDAIGLALESPAHHLPRYKRRQRQDARRWIVSESIVVGSFQWCCSILGLDAQCLRRELAR